MTNNIIGHKLYQWQSDFFKLFDKHPHNSVITCKSARQRGKTFTLLNLLLRQCINNRNYTAIVIVPTYQIARKQFKELTDMIVGVKGLVKSNNSTFFELVFFNGSTIKYKSAESKDNLRGETAHLLIVDEAAFVDLETFTQCCLPYVNTTKGNVVLISTPRFKTDSCLFYKYWRLAELGKKNCYNFDFCSYDTSALLSPEQLQMYKDTLAPNIFRNEVLGEFLDLSNELWNIEPILRNNVMKTDYLIGGIDFATNNNNDETSIAIFNSDKQMYQLFHFNDQSPTETISFIINILKQLPIKKLVVEKNSIGAIYLDLLKKKISQNNIRTQIIPFTTTNESKRTIIENLQLEIANQTITLLDEIDLKLEFSTYEMQTTKSGLITYNGASGYRDDIVMSVALCLDAFKQGNYAIR